MNKNSSQGRGRAILLIAALFFYVLAGPVIEIALIHTGAPRAAFDVFWFAYAPLAWVRDNIPPFGDALEFYSSLVSEWTAGPLPPP